MNWLHAMGGIGASLGPLIMGFALTNNFSWSDGYLIIAIIQSFLTATLFFTLNMWNDKNTEIQAYAELDTNRGLLL